MKKILALVLALVMCIGVASAFADKVGVSMPTKDLQRWNQDGEYMEKLLGEAGYEVELQYASNDVPTQLNQIETMIDNGCNVNEYPWSGYRAMFGHDNGEPTTVNRMPGRRVSELTKQERRALMHTGDRLDSVDWQLDDQNRLIPSSFCDHDYLEQVFEHDQAFFLKTIGGQNAAEMRQTIIDNPRRMLPDGEFFKAVNETSLRWFQTELTQLSLNQKVRLLPFIRRTLHTSIPQLARTFGMTREYVTQALGKK